MVVFEARGLSTRTHHNVPVQEDASTHYRTLPFYSDQCSYTLSHHTRAWRDHCVVSANK